jgi:hypothetical protein
MKRISVYVSERQHEGFHALGERLGQKASELMRQALNDFLERHGMGVTASSRTKPARRRASTRRRA